MNVSRVTDAWRFPPSCLSLAYSQCITNCSVKLIESKDVLFPSGCVRGPQCNEFDTFHLVCFLKASCTQRRRLIARPAMLHGVLRH